MKVLILYASLFYVITLFIGIGMFKYKSNTFTLFLGSIFIFMSRGRILYVAAVVFVVCYRVEKIYIITVMSLYTALNVILIKSTIRLNKAK